MRVYPEYPSLRKENPRRNVSNNKTLIYYKQSVVIQLPKNKCINIILCFPRETDRLPSRIVELQSLPANGHKLFDLPD